MVTNNINNCPVCGGVLKYYDKVKRFVKIKGNKKECVCLRRMRCNCCNKVHREFPSFIIPYKHYDANVINGVREGLITSETLGYEDYPCEMTMKRWRKRIGASTNNTRLKEVASMVFNSLYSCPNNLEEDEIETFATILGNTRKAIAKL